MVRYLLTVIVFRVYRRAHGVASPAAALYFADEGVDFLLGGVGCEFCHGLSLQFAGVVVVAAVVWRGVVGCLFALFLIFGCCPGK